MFDLQAALATGKHKQVIADEMYDYYIKQQQEMERSLAESSAKTQAILDYAYGNEQVSRPETRVFNERGSNRG